MILYITYKKTEITIICLATTSNGNLYSFYAYSETLLNSMAGVMSAIFLVIAIIEHFTCFYKFNK